MSNVHPRHLRSAGAALALAVAALLAGCQKDNPGFCGDSCPVDADVTDAPQGCVDNPALCTATESCVNDVCVDCSTGNNHQSSDCTDPAAPVCGADLDCHACTADSECDSSFCEAGQCIPTDDVIYVMQGAPDTTMCTADMKCGTPRYALTKVTAARKYMLVDPSPNPYRSSPDGAVTITTDLVIHGPGAIFERSGSNQIVEVTGGNVAITGVTIRGAAGGGGADDLKCTNATLALRSVTLADADDRGLEAANCVIDLQRSLVTGNTAGGVRVAAGRFTIGNSFFFDNGAANSAAGGLLLDPDATPNALEFNTIIRNTSTGNAGDAGGVLCLGTTAITARNNLIFGNIGNEAFGDSCTHSYTVFGPVGGPAGTVCRSMTAVEAALVNVNGTTAADFHLTAASLLRGAAEPGSATGADAVDYDGDARPNPAGGAADIGADETP